VDLHRKSLRDCNFPGFMKPKERSSGSPTFPLKHKRRTVALGKVVKKLELLQLSASVHVGMVSQ
jgi:hypothetical protein